MPDLIKLTPNTYYQLPITWYLLPACDPLSANNEKAFSQIGWQKKIGRTWMVAAHIQSIWTPAAGEVAALVPRRSK